MHLLLGRVSFEVSDDENSWNSFPSTVWNKNPRQSWNSLICSGHVPPFQLVSGRLTRIYIAVSST